MSFEEFVAWLARELRAGMIEELQVADLVAQRTLFDKDRAMIEREFGMRVAGYVANELRSGPTVRELLRHAQEEFPGRMLYFEPIGYRAFS
jgi:hypothetical protein